MYKEGRKIYSFLFALLGLLISTAVYADDGILQNVQPHLDNDNEVCAFMMSPVNATYNLTCTGDDYSDPDNAGGTYQFVLQGQEADGTYLYKWTRPANAQGVPGNIKIEKNGASDVTYSGSFVNQGIYMEYVKKGLSHGEFTTRADVADPAKDEKVTIGDNENCIFLETTTQDKYKIWPYGNGHDKYADNGWPGDELSYVGQLTNGHYLYKWTQTQYTDAVPTNMIISDGLQDKISTQTNPDGSTYDLAYTNHGYYQYIITTDPSTTLIQQFGKVYPATTSTVSSNLDPLVHLNNESEVSIFLESPDDATYYIWPYDGDGTNGTHTGSYYTGTTYPGEVIEKRPQQLANGHYLYKWTLPTTRVDPNLHHMPLQFTISKRTSKDGVTPITFSEIFKDKTFTNHGYYLVTDDAEGNSTVKYTDEVTRLSNGTYTTSRTTFGQRVIYEMNIGAFAGTFANAQRQLTNLKTLGVDVIWLMPIYNHVEGGSPYAVTDYMNPYPKYGSLADLKSFVSAAHDLKMDVWLDFVPNHTSDKNAWVTEHPEYYSKGADGKMVRPTYVENGETKTFDDVYQLDYSSTVTDANGETYNPAGRAIRNVLEYWIKQTDIDGFRFDYASSPTIPNVFWTSVTSYLKGIKPSLQFLAEADFSSTGLPQTSFQYDYAWDFAKALRTFSYSTPDNTWADTGTDNLSYITNEFIRKTNGFTDANGNVNRGVSASRMVYLMNHDINRNEIKKTMSQIYGENRYNMTVYEFTMPGMPLIFNGQEQDGTVQYDFYTDNTINWSGTRDPRMVGLIQELARLKHTNNALNDGNTSDQRGDLFLLNSYDHNVLAYERVKGDQHVLVVINKSASAKNPTILGATTGTWKRVLSGNNEGLQNHSDDVEIGSIWNLNQYPVPGYGYEIFTYTGPSNTIAPAYYLVTNDSWDDDTKHKMVRGDNSTVDKKSYYTYHFTITKDDFKAIAGSDNSLEFKLQEYYTFEDRTVCKNDQMYGSKGVDSPVFTYGSDNKSYKSTLDKDGSAANKFTLNYSDDVVKYIVTFSRGIEDDKDCHVSVEYLIAGQLQDGYYLETPVNITSTETATVHKWRFNYQSEDPANVSDNWLTKINKDLKFDLSSFVIDADDFDTYIPADRQASHTIQFRVRLYLNGDDVKNPNTGLVQDICPLEEDGKTSASTFDASKESNKVYEQAHWDPYDASNENYFKIVYQPDVSKYIIQIWKTSGGDDGATRVRVYYVRKFNYPGSTIEDVTASGEDVYLYNVDSQKFLYTGNTWGTMASVLYSDLGTRLNISKGVTSDNPDYKLIRTRFENNTTVPNGHMLGVDDMSYTANANPQTDWDKFLNLDSANVYCDRDNGNRWIFEKLDTVSYANTYLLKLYNTNDNRFHYMIADHGHSDQNLNTRVYYIAQNVTKLDADAMDDRRYLKNGADEFADYIRRLGNGKGYIDIPYTAPKAGTYSVTVRYMTNGDKNLTASVKDGDSSTKVAASTGSDENRNIAQPLTFNLHLNRGSNHIYIAKQDEVAPNIRDVEITMDRPDDLSYARWQLVTYSDLVAKLKNENAELYGGTSADATFLLKDQGFTRYIQGTWDTDNGNYVNYNIIDEQGKTSTTGRFRSTVSCTKNAIGDNRDWGMYWNGHLHGRGIVYQDVDVPMYGVYQFDAYGFYHGSETKMFYQYATAFNADGSVKTWSPMYVGDNLKYNEDYFHPRNNHDTQIQLNDVKWGQEFYEESVLGTKEPTYKNTKFIYVPQENKTEHTGAATTTAGNYRIRIGFYKTAEDVDNFDYTAVDDVHLHYNGKSPFMLKDEWKESDYKTNTKDEKSEYIPVWLKRKFAAKAWNTLVLPVSVSVAQLKAIFGNNVKLAEPYGLDDDNPYTIKFTLIDISKVAGDAIVAGRYYIVYPEQLNGTNNVMYVNSDGTPRVEKIEADEAGALYYDLGSHNLTGGLTQDDVPELPLTDFHYYSKNHQYDHNEIRFIGSYYTKTVDAPAYIFASDNKMYHIKNPLTLPGYRFYIKDASNTQSTKSKDFTLSSLSDDLDDLLASFNKNSGETTGIEEVDNGRNTGNGHVDNFDVYDLSGRRVAVDGKVDGLPRGVYIINGRKFIKK